MPRKQRKPNLAVEEHDERGPHHLTGKYEQFGFVYFNDGARVGYTPGLEDKPGYTDLWPGNWEPCTEQHMRLAREYLTQKGLLPPVTEPAEA